MKKIICELCGNSDFLKENGFFVCQSCGTKYSLADAKKLLGESTSKSAATASEQVAPTASNKVVSTASGQVENYSLLAMSALKSDKFSEAESYCNKVIEVRPRNSAAWFFKGCAVGRASGIKRVRILEAITCFSNAISFTDEAKKDKVKAKALAEIQNITDSHMKVLCDSFYKQPCGFYDSMIWFIDHFQKVVCPFISLCGGDAQGSMSDMGLRMFNAAASSYKHASFHMHDKQYWGAYSKDADKCIDLFKRYLKIEGLAVDEKIGAYENIIFICEELLSTYPVVNVILDVDPIVEHYKKLMADCRAEVNKLSGAPASDEGNGLADAAPAPSTADTNPSKEVEPAAPKAKSSRWLWFLIIPAVVVTVAVAVLLAVVGSRYYDSNFDPDCAECVEYEDYIVFETPDSTAVEEEEPSITYSDGVLSVYGVDYPMVLVDGGLAELIDSDEDTSQYLESFMIGIYEVTQYIWEAVMGTDVYQQRDMTNPKWSLRGVGDNYPMYYVNYYEALEFCSRLNAMTGQNFYIPSELQWEYAARGGYDTDSYSYSGSDNVYSVAWFKDNSDGLTHVVGGKSPNSLGIYDMSGNVREWCSDGYGSEQVLRGGGWFNDAESAEVSSRYYDKPDVRDNNYGFRLCL